MATLFENREKQMMNVTEEAQKHNAQISERYRKLQDAVASQFAEAETVSNREETQNVASKPIFAPEAPTYNPVFTQETSAVEQTPQITEYVSVRSNAPVFTTDRLERAFAPTREMPIAKPVVAPTPTATVSVAKEEQYVLSAAAKVVMAVFVAVIVAMLTMICINSQIIRQKSIKIRNLEEKREELLNQEEDLQRRIQIAQSEETILAYAQELGLLPAGN